MIGTIFSATLAMALTPPIKIVAQIAAKNSPLAQFGIPNAPLKPSEMELAWTIFPINPSAKMIASAKNAAKTLA